MPPGGVKLFDFGADLCNLRGVHFGFHEVEVALFKGYGGIRVMEFVHGAVNQGDEVDRYVDVCVVANGEVDHAAAVQALVVKAGEADACACAAEEAEQGSEAGEQFQVDHAGNLFAAAPRHEADDAEEQGHQVAGVHFKDVLLGDGIEYFEGFGVVFKDGEEQFGVGFAAQLAHGRVDDHGTAHFRQFDEEGAICVRDLFG